MLISRRCGYALVSIVLLALASQPVVAGNDEAAFKAAYEAAEASRKKAADVGFEWRDTKKIMKQAEEAATGGDYDKAVKLANKAKRQGEFGVAQSEEQAKTWQQWVLK